MGECTDYLVPQSLYLRCQLYTGSVWGRQIAKIWRPQNPRDVVVSSVGGRDLQNGALIELPSPC